MAVSKEELAERALRLGFEHGMVVREVGYDDDIDQGLHDSVDVIASQDLLDLDWDGLADAVIFWFRDEDDDDLASMLGYALDLLGERGMIWLLTPKAGRTGHVQPGVIETAARARGLSRSWTTGVAEHWDGCCLTSDGR
ncbi:DUF3052 family protein [Kitasatospora sp. NPDC059648]|uniref:DUF3052 family protein n=1 Tax=Kitasatospora sp. NPDC059648 TaxID=3346894 RepID=UPI0036C33A6C